MNVNTGYIKFHHVSGNQEFWSGRFCLPGDKTVVLHAQTDNDGYNVAVKETTLWTIIAEFKIPNFGDHDIQVITTDKGRKMRAARDVNRIDLAMFAR